MAQPAIHCGPRHQPGPAGGRLEQETEPAAGGQLPWALSTGAARAHGAAPGPGHRRSQQHRQVTSAKSRRGPMCGRKRALPRLARRPLPPCFRLATETEAGGVQGRQGRGRWAAARSVAAPLLPTYSRPLHPSAPSAPPGNATDYPEFVCCCRDISLVYNASSSTPRGARCCCGTYKVRTQSPLP